jgi:fucose permease
MSSSNRFDTRPSLAAWRLAVFAVFAINGATLATWVARTPAIRDALGVNLEQFGMLIFGLAAGSIIGLLGSSHVIARVGTRTSILGGILTTLAMIAIVGIGSAQFGSYPVVLVAMALYGAAMGITDVAMNVEGAGVEQEQGRAIMPWFHAAWSGGTIVGAAVAAGVAGLGVGLDVHIAGVAIALSGATLLVVRALPRHRVLPGLDDDGPGPERSTFGERMAIWKEPRTLIIGLVVLGMAFAEGTANDWLALAMVDDRGVDEATGAFYFGIFAVAMTTGRIVGVPLLNRFGRVPVLLGSAIFAIIGLTLLITIDDPVIAGISIFVWGLGASLGFPVGMSAAADDPDKAAARVAAVATVGYFAFLVGPPLIGFLGERVGLINALWVVLALVVLTAVSSPSTRERGANARERQPQSAA